MLGNVKNAVRKTHLTQVRAIVRSMAPVRQLKGLSSRISVVLGVVTITGLVLWNTELPSECSFKIWCSFSYSISMII